MNNPLRDRLSSLPLIIAGPILRRTEAASVTVWLALKSSTVVTLNVYEGGIVTPSALKLTGSLETIELGDSLHIVAVTASTGTPLQSNQVYCYDLDFGIYGEFELGGIYNEFGDISSLCYGGYSRPTFVLPPNDLNDVRIIHGSCRKPHGGQNDALAYLDELIKNSLGNTLPGQSNQRPQQCYFTGDQIYADDVASQLLLLIDNASKDLLGWVEELPGVTSESVTEKLPDIIQQTKREAIITAAQLTAFDKGTNHLMRLGEYYAMYLFCWSDVLWPTTLPSFREVYVDAEIKEVQTGSTKPTKEGSLYAEQSKALLNFRATLPAVRRALANIPCYMMCDDHEVTDDWFLSLKWVTDVYGNLLGKRIVQNGITAFAIFQSWGNKPSSYLGNTSGKGLLTALEALHNDRGDTTSTQWRTVEGLILPRLTQEGSTYYNTILADLEQPVGMEFSFSIVFNKFILIALDSRLRRAFSDIDAPEKAPALLSYTALEAQIVGPYNNLPNSVEVALVLCPAPVFGHALVEDIVQKAVIAIDDRYSHPKASNGRIITGAENQDREAWAFNPDGMQGVLRELSRYKRVVLFSGDVHYGFSIGIDYNRHSTSTGNNNPPPRAFFTQLVCSSLKNQDAKTLLTGRISEAIRLENGGSYSYAVWSFKGAHVSERVRTYIKVNGIPVPNGFIDKPVYSSESPTVMKMHAGTSLVDAVNDPPQVTYTLQFGKDDRPVTTRYPGAIPPTFANTDSLGIVDKAFTFTRKFGNTVSVGDDQIGDVTFNWGTSNKAIMHKYWFKPTDYTLPSGVNIVNGMLHVIDIPSF